MTNVTEKEYIEICKRKPSCYCEKYYRVLGLASQTPECLRRYFELKARKEMIKDIDEIIKKVGIYMGIEKSARKCIILDLEELKKKYRGGKDG